jgi:hypothetical protein
VLSGSLSDPRGQTLFSVFTGDQTTTYVYGTAAGGITPEIYRNDLLRAEIYPDSDDTTSLGNGTEQMGFTTGSSGTGVRGQLLTLDTSRRFC